MCRSSKGLYTPEAKHISDTEMRKCSGKQMKEKVLMGQSKGLGAERDSHVEMQLIPDTF